jgi:predicted RNA-binding Zn-ribbon protein involved in translation (DUF1610 family)
MALTKRFKAFQLTMETVRALPVGGAATVPCPLCGQTIIVSRPSRDGVQSHCLTRGCWRLSLNSPDEPGGDLQAKLISE